MQKTIKWRGLFKKESQEETETKIPKHSLDVAIDFHTMRKSDSEKETIKTTRGKRQSHQTDSEGGCWQSCQRVA